MKRLKISAILLTLLLLLVPVSRVYATEYEEPEAVEESGEYGEEFIEKMPDWYPEDPANFEFFHDENAPRVVDNANIFDPWDKDAMEEVIKVIRNELKRDVVVFTDDSTHGLGRAVYCADFYDFNGYGYGEEREGFCLFICMDPADRGVYTCSTGSDSRGLHTESNAAFLDNDLRPYMEQGDYGPGVIEWIKKIYRLYIKGNPGAPDWFPNRGEVIERFHDNTAPRVEDNVGVLTDAQIEELEEEIEEISEQFNTDIVILVDEVPSEVYLEYPEYYYMLNGYGVGDDYSGMMLLIDKKEYLTSPALRFFGSTVNYYTAVGWERLDRNVRHYTAKDDSYAAAKEYLKDIKHFLKTGRVPLRISEWLMAIGAAILGGSVIGGILLGFAALKMRVPRVKKEASDYLVPDSFKAVAVKDDLIGTTTSRHFHLPDRSGSGSSSSDSGSSYSSSYSGSSGSDHSGSGFNF